MATSYNTHLQYLTTSRRDKIIGVAFPLDTQGTGGIFTSNEGIKSIRDGLIQLLLTSRGERVMRPSFGTHIRRQVFDPNDALAEGALKAQITEAIATYEPRVVIKELEVSRNENQLKIRLRLSLKDELLRDEVVEIII